MDIDINDLTAPEIIRVLTNFPNGRLVTKHDRIFWESINANPVRPNEAARNMNPMQSPQGFGDMGKRFEKMADTLGSMVC